jgi:serine/threonine protein kinase
MRTAAALERCAAWLAFVCCHRHTAQASNVAFTFLQVAANTLLNQTQLCSRFVSPLTQVLTEVAGTMGYMAPELLKRCYTEAADVWSAGVMLYEMIAGQLPFSLGNTVDEVRDAG